MFSQFSLVLLSFNNPNFSLLIQPPIHQLGVSTDTNPINFSEI